jgi:uncharacterized membrane protein
MRKDFLLFLIFLCGQIALPIHAQPTEGVAEGADMEKCYGISQPGGNDGPRPSEHVSLRRNTKDSKHPLDWVYVKRNTCEKLGGQLAFPTLPYKDEISPNSTDNCRSRKCE